MKNILFFVFFSSFLLFLEKKQENVKSDKKFKNTFECYFDATRIDTGDYAIKVEGWYIDDSVMCHLYRQVPISQVLTILKKDSILYSESFFAPYDLDVTYAGLPINVMEYRITEIGILGEGEKMLFFVSAYSGGYIEVCQMFNTKGEIISLNAEGVEIKSVGNLQKILQEHNIKYNPTYRLGEFYKKNVIPTFY